jgi:hypothetical protein
MGIKEKAARNFAEKGYKYYSLNTLDPDYNL